MRQKNREDKNEEKIEKVESVIKKPRKENKWVNLAKQYKELTGCSYKIALREVSETRKKLKK